MKILLLGPAYPLRGGIAHFATLLAEHLKKDHTVELVTFKRQYPALIFPGKSQHEADETTRTKPAELLIDSINPLNWLRVGSKLRQREADLAIFSYWLPFFGPCYGTIARSIKRNGRTKVLFLCHNIIPHERRPGDIFFTRYAFQPADYFLVQSEEVAKDLRSLLPDARYKKAFHPVYEIFGEPLTKTEARARLGISTRKVILYFGYVRRYKGLSVLIEAMSQLVNGGPAANDVTLLIVGEFYEGETDYRRQVRNAGLESRVRFVSDYVPNDEVKLYFSAADIVVLPYRSATQSGIVPIAYNFDKPVITTRVGGLPEVVIDGKTGYVVPPNDPAALSEAIRRFYEGNMEHEFVENVRAEKKKYSWETFVKTLEELVSS